MLASTVLGSPPQSQDPWSHGRAPSVPWWNSPRKGGCGEAQPDAAPAHCSPQGRGLHPLRDGHGEAPLPRLHGQGGAAPHLPTPRSVSGRYLPLATRGRQNSVQPRRIKGLGRGAPTCSQRGRDPCGLCHSLPPPPSLHPSQSPVALDPHYALPTPPHLPRDPYGRDMARCDGPVGVQSLQFPPVPPPAAHQPRSQVALPPHTSSPAHGPAVPPEEVATHTPTPHPIQARPMPAPSSCRLDTDGIHLLTNLLLVSCAPGPAQGQAAQWQIAWKPQYPSSVLTTHALPHIPPPRPTPRCRRGTAFHTVMGVGSL